MPLVASDYDAAALWPALMGMALDQRQLLASLNDSQATLRTAYEQARALSDTVRELGCPLIPLLPGVLLVPLIGAIDELRSRQIIDQVLNGVAEARAHRVLLDITGVPLVDTQVAGTLIQMARAVGLLGARVTLVGVRPEIAQSIVSLGVELSLIETRPTLASALQALIKRGP
jgi:anti-anti-sigma regulatory factor